MAQNVLQHLIYGWPNNPQDADEAPALLALTDEIDQSSAQTLRDAISIHPVSSAEGIHSQTVAFVPIPKNIGLPDGYVLARTHTSSSEPFLPIYQYIYIPSETFYGIGGDLQILVNLIADPIEHSESSQSALEPLTLPIASTWSLDHNISSLKSFMEQSADGNIVKLFEILGAALLGGAVITGFPEDWRARTALVRGLMMLLPTPARIQLSFCTHGTAAQIPQALIIFDDSPDAVSNIDWQSSEIDDAHLAHPYIAYLNSLWEGDLVTLMTTLRPFDLLAIRIMPGQQLTEGLESVITRHEQDQAVQSGEPVSLADMMTTLTGPVPPIDMLRIAYLERVLQSAIEERDSEAALYVANELDQNPKLDSHFQNIFDDALESQPDAVYVFVRARLSEGVDQQWLQRLHNAARQSLAVAIESGDPNTISSWLTLIAREPARYELAPILSDGILSAREPALNDPHLAQELLTLAVKRQSDTLATLLADTALMNILPELIRSALQDFNSEAIAQLATLSRDLFLLTLSRALESGQPCINIAAIRSLWEIHDQGQTTTLPVALRPITLIQQITHNTGTLTHGALETLLSLILASGDDETFYELAAILADQEQLAPGLGRTLEHSGRPVDDLSDLITTLISNELLNAQDAVDTLVTLLVNHTWGESSRSLIEQLTRLLTQNADLSVENRILWSIAEVSGTFKNEPMLKMATRRLLNDAEELISEEQTIEMLLRLRSANQWSTSGDQIVVRWWRQFTHAKGQVQLQKLDKILDGKRPLEDLRATVQTIIALRRVVGQRTLDEFAEAISLTYTVLQALSEGFDPEGKISISVDSTTLRSEMDARADELPADVRHVLATNLKELAHLITTLSDNRSKPSIMRSDEALERQLVTGEQHPQSAIDVMRWLSGYFDGLQRDEDS